MLCKLPLVPVLTLSLFVILSIYLPATSLFARHCINDRSSLPQRFPFPSHLHRHIRSPGFSYNIDLSLFLHYLSIAFLLRKKIRMNSHTDSLPSITISPPSSPELETDNTTQTMNTAPNVEQMSNYHSSDDGLDRPLPAARSIPVFRPAQSTTNTRQGVYKGNNSNTQLEIQCYWDRDKTHKLHLDLHLRRHHRPQQPKQDDVPQGFNYSRERDRMHQLHLRLHLPRHSSLSSERRPELGSDGIEAPIVFMTTVPPLKYHRHLECITYARLTQKEYEKRILTRE